MFSSGGPSVRFLTRYDGEVSEPLLGHQGSLMDIDRAKINRTLKGTVGLLISLNPLLIFATTEDPSP